MSKHHSPFGPHCARCSGRFVGAAHVAAIAMPPDAPVAMFCSPCHAITLRDPGEALLLRQKLLGVPRRHQHDPMRSAAWARAERLFVREAA